MTDQAISTGDAEEARKREARERWEAQAREKGWVRFNFNGSPAGRDLAQRIAAISRECSAATAVELLRVLLRDHPDAASPGESDPRAAALLAAVDGGRDDEIAAALAELGLDVVQRSRLTESEDLLERERRAREAAEGELASARVGGADPQELARQRLRIQVLEEEVEAAGSQLAAERAALARAEAALAEMRVDAERHRAEVARLMGELAAARTATPAGQEGSLRPGGGEAVPGGADLGGIDAGPRLSAPARPAEEAPRGMLGRLARRLGGGGTGKARRIAVASAIGCFAASGLAMVMSQGMGARESTAEPPRMALAAPALGQPEPGGAGSEGVAPLPGLMASAGTAAGPGPDPLRPPPSAAEPQPAKAATQGSAASSVAAASSASQPAPPPATVAPRPAAAPASQGGTSAGGDLFGLADESPGSRVGPGAARAPSTRPAESRASAPVAPAAPAPAAPAPAVPATSAMQPTPPPPPVPGLLATAAAPEPPKPAEPAATASAPAGAEVLVAALDEAARMLERAAEREARLIEQGKALQAAAQAAAAGRPPPAKPGQAPPEPPQPKPVQAASAQLRGGSEAPPCGPRQRLADVRHGETLARAAQRLGLRLERIYESNPGLEPTAPNLPLSQGQICIPVEG